MKGREITMDFEKIKYSVSNGIASIKLNSPKNLNAFDEALVGDAIAAFDLCEKDDAVKVVVLSGEGKAFSGGGDIGFFYKGVQDDNVDLEKLVKMAGELAVKIKKLHKPVIASVHGAAAGAGFSAALLCDFCIAADNTKFIQAFVNLGLVPDTGGAYLLAKSVGVNKAAELIMTGRVVTAQEAKDLGIVYQVTTVEELEEATMKFAKKLASGPSVSYAYMKDMLYQTSFKDFDKFLAMEAEYQIRCSKTKDFKEGVIAFVEKRKAEFKGI